MHLLGRYSPAACSANSTGTAGVAVAGQRMRSGEPVDDMREVDVVAPYPWARLTRSDQTAIASGNSAVSTCSGILRRRIGFGIRGSTVPNRFRDDDGLPSDGLKRPESVGGFWSGRREWPAED